MNVQHTTLDLTIGKRTFRARLCDDRAPQTCAAFRTILPWRQEVVHARWSGEACWIPMGSLDLGIGPENPTSQPLPGEILFYPAAISETEILIAYGLVRFASVAGPLAGTPFLTITEKLDQLAEAGREILWGGAQPIRFALGGPTN